MEKHELLARSASGLVVAGPVGTEVLSWGANSKFQLGDGTRTGRDVPGSVVLPEASTMAQVSAGYDFGLVLTTSGLVWAWGNNASGQLGNNSTAPSDRAVPVQLSLAEGETVTAVSAGDNHAMALTSDGDVYTWGSNQYGQLGIGDTNIDKRLTPVQVTIPWSKLGLPEATTVTAVAAGYGFCLALTSTQQVLAWGWNQDGELGNNDDKRENQYSPVLVQLPTQVKVTAIAAGAYHGLAITTSNVVLAWGWNQYGQLGNPKAGGSSAVPVSVQLPEHATITAISGGLWHCLARVSDGSILAWGSNFYGELGNPKAGQTSDVPVPVQLPDGVTVTVIAASGIHSLAVTSTKQVLAWGLNGDGQVGDGSMHDRTSPVWVKLPSGVQAHTVSGDGAYSLAVVSPGPRLAWGANDTGQLGNGDPQLADQHTAVDVDVPADAVFTALAAGDSHSLAVAEAGQVLAWGSNRFAQLGIGPDRPGNHPDPEPVLLPEEVIPVAVAAGTAHSLALSTAGEVCVWGRNNYGQLGLGDKADRGNYPTPIRQRLDWLPHDANRVVAVAASHLHSLVLLANGKVYGFGFNYYGQLGTGDTRTRYTPAPMQLPEGISVTGIVAGGTFSLILASDGTAYGCGFNYYGQLGTGDNTQLLTPDKTKPVVVPEGVTGITTISAGGSHSLAITTDGKALAFGANTNGQLGYGQPGTNANTAGYVDTSGLNLPTGTTIAATAAGGAHSLAVTSGGLILAWGDNSRGQLGNNYPHQASRPQPVSQSLGTNGSAVAAGQYHSLAR